MNNRSFPKFVCLVLSFYFLADSIAQHTVALVAPAKCLSIQGSISISGFTGGTPYSVIYNKDSTVQPAINIIADGAGNIVIGGLEAGSYTGISVTPVAGGAAVNIIREQLLTDRCLAKQSVKFFATGYGNFTGIQR